jgi:WD40 repeat protein
MTMPSRSIWLYIMLIGAVLIGAALPVVQAQAVPAISAENAAQVTQIGSLQVAGVTHIAWSPDPARSLLGVATLYGVFVYDIDALLNGIIEPIMMGGDDRPAQDLAFSPDGSLLAAASGSVVRVFDVASGTERLTLQGTSPIIFNGDGTRLLYTANNVVRVYDLVEQSEIGALNGHSDRINDVIFSRDGSLIVTASQDMTLRYWSAADLEQVGFSRSRRNPILSLAISPNGALIASGTRRGIIRLLNLAVDIERTYQPPGARSPINSIEFNTDGSLLLFTIGTSVQLVEPDTRTVLLNFNDHTQAVQQATFSPDGARFATAAMDNTVFIYGLAESMN